MTGLILQKKLRSFIDKNIYNFTICCVFILFLILSIYKVQQTELFYSYDPFYHYHITKHWEVYYPFSDGAIGYGEKDLRFDYPTVFRTLTSIFSQVSKIDLILIYKYSGIFLRVLAGISFYVLIRNLTNSRFVAILCLSSFLFNPYLFVRSLISYPENMVLIFHILVLNSAVSAIRTNKLNYSIFLFFGFALIIHFRSLIFPLLTICFTTAYLFFVHFSNKTVMRLLTRIMVGSLLTLAVSLPVIASAVETYTKYARENVGSGASLKTRYETAPQYTPPDFFYYSEQIGKFSLPFYIFLSLFLIKIPSFKKYKSQLLLFGLLTIVGLSLTRGKQLNLYIPPLRMFSYLTISFLPLIAIAIYIFKKYANQNLFNFSICFLIIASIINVSSVYGWVGLKKDDIEMGYRLNTQLDNNSVVIWNSINPINLGVYKYTQIETDWELNHMLVDLFKTDRQLFFSEIGNLYPNRKLYIVTSDNLENIHKIDETKSLFIYFVPAS